METDPGLPVKDGAFWINFDPDSNNKEKGWKNDQPNEGEENVK